MIKSKKQMFIVISVFALILFLGGTTYAWFTYRSTTSSQQLIAGNIYLVMEEGNDTISLTNIFPETKEEARSRNDNYMTFEISGVNESGKTIYYEIDLNHGTDKASPNERFRDQDLRFDLIEIGTNNEETYLLSNVGFDTLENKKIWIDTVEGSTSTEVSRRYKLRMWLSDEVIISDTDPNKTYNATGYNNHYANIKVAVIGDFTERFYGYQKLERAIDAKKATEPNTCGNITYTDTEDGITYLSGTNNCIDFNYVWYSGKLWRITAIYPDGAMKLVTQNNITSIAFNESEQVNFYTDANTTSYMYQWLNEDFYDTLYHASDFIDTSKQWNATMPVDTTISTKPGNTNLVTANVGLINSYEYYNSYRCIGQNTDACTGTSYSTGYLNIGYYWWLLNPYNTSNIRRMTISGNDDYDIPTSLHGSRPSIYLKSGLEFTGEGTSFSPYKIVGDKDIGVANELINTRLSGEYVKLDNGTTNQLFRIIGIEDNKTKIIAMDYAGIDRIFATSSSDILWGSGTTTDADTMYTFLNTSTTGYFDTLVSTYGELFDNGLYYLGTSGYNYKLSVCANTTTGKTSVCEKTSQVGTFNIGLPRYGEMFATQQKGGYSNSANMWLINSYSSSKVWYLNYYNIGHDIFSISSQRARPTVHLKSTVKIISGTGTETDPYVVGL